MNIYNLCLAWNWEGDADFASLLHSACTNYELSLLQATPANIIDTVHSLTDQQTTIQALLDRASDSDACFLSLVEWASQNNIYCLNSFEKTTHSNDKASMHLTFITAGLQTPYTIILPPQTEQPTLPSIDLRVLGEKFTIKPAHGGGGKGVVMDATSLDQIYMARQTYPQDKYLLQANITPKEFDSHPAWFRVIYCANHVYPCWWHPYTHIYIPVTSDEENRYGLAKLREVTISIANLTHLDLFSTEIALTADGLFVAVDYVNDQLDLRLQSKEKDGVPDEIVENIAGCLVKLVLANCKLSTTN